MPKFWVELNSNSRLIINFFLSWSKEKSTMTLELELITQVNSVLGQITVTRNLKVNIFFRAYLAKISKVLAALSFNPLGVWNHLGMKKRVLWETRKRKTNLRSRRMGKKIFSFWPNLLRFIFVSTVAKTDATDSY